MGLRVLAVGNDNRDDVHLASLQLAHRGESDLLVLRCRVENDEHSGHSRVDLEVVEQVVRDRGDGEALAVQVGQLLHLEAAFLGHSLSQSLSEEHDALGCLEDFGRALGESDTALECLFHVGGQVSQLVDVPGTDALRLVVTFHLREPKSNKCEDNNLRNVCLCRRHRKFTPAI